MLTEKEKSLQTPPAARDYYARKVEELGKNLQDLEKIVQGKQGNLNMVEDGKCIIFEFSTSTFIFFGSWAWIGGMRGKWSYLQSG